MKKLLKGIIYLAGIGMCFVIAGDIFPTIGSIIKTNFKNLNEIKSNIFPPPTSMVTPTEAIQIIEIVPTIDIKSLKSECVDEITAYIKENQQDKDMTTAQAVFVINSRYRICLARNGLTPEDLLSPLGSSQNSNSSTNNSSAEQIQQNPVKVDYLKQYQDEQKQYENEQRAKCQIDISKYNACMSEYNIQLSEYSTCLSGANQYTYCYKPLNLCYKPICAY